MCDHQKDEWERRRGEISGAVVPEIRVFHNAIFKIYHNLEFIGKCVRGFSRRMGIPLPPAKMGVLLQPGWGYTHPALFFTMQFLRFITI